MTDPAVIASFVTTYMVVIGYVAVLARRQRKIGKGQQGSVKGGTDA